MSRGETLTSIAVVVSVIPMASAVVWFYFRARK